MSAESVDFYTCRRCGEKLFSQTEVLHSPQRDTSNEGNVNVSAVKTVWSDARRQDHVTAASASCSSVFLVDAPDWGPQLVSNAGRIVCRKCSTRVGSFSWSGETCSCGRWITPAFQFQLARVDCKRALPAAVLIRGSSDGAPQLEAITAAARTQSDGVGDARAAVPDTQR